MNGSLLIILEGLAIIFNTFRKLHMIINNNDGVSFE